MSFCVPTLSVIMGCVWFIFKLLLICLYLNWGNHFRNFIKIFLNLHTSQNQHIDGPFLSLNSQSFQLCDIQLLEFDDEDKTTKRALDDSHIRAVEKSPSNLR